MKEKIMRQELRKMLDENQTADNILSMLKDFGLTASLRSIKFILKQDCSVDEKVFSIISSFR